MMNQFIQVFDGVKRPRTDETCVKEDTYSERLILGWLSWFLVETLANSGFVLCSTVWLLTAACYLDRWKK
jgi:hypothetical protein